MESTACIIEEYSDLPDICSYCQQPYDGLINRHMSKTIDHIVPQRELYRQDKAWKFKRLTYSHIDNLLLCCKRCNRLKGHKTLYDFRDIVIKNAHPTFKLSKDEQTSILNSIDILLYNYHPQLTIVQDNY